MVNALKLWVLLSVQLTVLVLSVAAPLYYNAQIMMLVFDVVQVITSVFLTSDKIGELVTWGLLVLSLTTVALGATLLTTNNRAFAWGIFGVQIAGIALSFGVILNLEFCEGPRSVTDGSRLHVDGAAPWGWESVSV